MVDGGRPLLPEILGANWPQLFKTAIFNRYSLVAPQPLDLVKKSSIITKNEEVDYELSNEPEQRTLPKTQIDHFSSKVYFSRRKSAANSSFVWKLSAAKS